jgi:Cu(I)/Ag(I) efflux system membrane protein CusA/SilA
MQGWPQTLLVLASLPFALAGSIWLLSYLHYNLSTAVWVGLIAVAGVAAETGIVMVVYLDEAFARYVREGRIRVPADVDAAVIEGASARVRPLLMTVATTVLGLLPLLWESGVGADVSARTAAPVVGGLWSCLVLTLLVLPASYAMWRRSQVGTWPTPSELGDAPVSTGSEAAPEISPIFEGTDQLGSGPKSEATRDEHVDD